MPLFLAWTFSTACALDFHEWNLLAIQDGGRRKPMDTFAREVVVRLTGRSTLRAAGRVWEPSDFVCSLAFGTHQWDQEPLILLGYRPLAQELGLDPAAKRFSVAQLGAAPRLHALLEEAAALRRTGRAQELSRAQKEAENLAGRLAQYAALKSGQALTIFPPANGTTWLPPGDGVDRDAMQRLEAVVTAYAAGDGVAFSVNARQLREDLERRHPNHYPPVAALRFEQLYNRLDLLDHAAWLYAAATVLLLATHWRGRGGLLRGAGLALAGAGLLAQTAGITMRCIIAGRPPVTNMYESVVWVAFGVVVFGAWFALRCRNLMHLLAALPTAALCLVLVARMPVAMPAAIDPLVPVLRNNFWLTVHVLTITLSYAAFLLAMVFGHIVLWRHLTAPTAAARDATLHLWLYRVLQLGVLLLAAGTILGGVWANYSWGRFWGWDPKETWALIALLCYLFVLHGRLAGWWGQFGLAVASVVCFGAVLMTWYGVNFVLGKGLHSYGFGIGGEGWVAAFVLADLAFVLAAWVRHARARA